MFGISFQSKLELEKFQKLNLQRVIRITPAKLFLVLKSQIKPLFIQKGSPKCLKKHSLRLF